VGGRVFEFLNSPHRAAEALMPWLLNGTLEPAEHRRLEAHLLDCAACRAELERQRRLAALYGQVATAEPERAGSAAFARLAARLDAEGVPRKRRSASAFGWRIVAALQFCVIAALIWTVWALRPDATEPDGRIAAYRGLGASVSAASGDALVFFGAETTNIEIRRTLQQAGARIIDGPTRSGAYVLRFERDAIDTAIESLRRDGHVVRVEPLAAANGSSAAPRPSRD